MNIKKMKFFKLVLIELKPRIVLEKDNIFLDCGSERSCTFCDFLNECEKYFFDKLPVLKNEDLEIFRNEYPELFI